MLIVAINKALPSFFATMFPKTTTKCRKTTTKMTQITVNNVAVESELSVPCVTAINEQPLCVTFSTIKRGKLVN